MWFISKPKTMKRLLSLRVILSFAFTLFAQENDSILLARTDMLKKEIGMLKKKNRSLQAQIYKMQNAHKADIQGLKDEIAAANAEIEETMTATGGLEVALQESEESTLEGLTVLGDWSKKVITILAIVLCVLFIILLILVISNRSRIQKDFLKLEAKVDNTKESVEQDLKEAMKKHEEDMLALKAQIEKGKNNKV